MLTYYVDLACWYLEGHESVEVLARGNGKVLREAGHDVQDVTWTIITFDNGAVVNPGIYYALPAHYPTHGQSPRFEVLGSDGVILLDVDNRDSILYTDNGSDHAYVPDHKTNMLFMQTNSSGDWAMGDFWGPIANETSSWIDHLVTGSPSPHAAAAEGRRTLAITLAIEESAHTGKTIEL